MECHLQMIMRRPLVLVLTAVLLPLASPWSPTTARVGTGATTRSVLAADVNIACTLLGTAYRKPTNGHHLTAVANSTWLEVTDTDQIGACWWQNPACESAGGLECTYVGSTGCRRTSPPSPTTSRSTASRPGPDTGTGAAEPFPGVRVRSPAYPAPPDTRDIRPCVDSRPRNHSRGISITLLFT